MCIATALLMGIGGDAHCAADPTIAPTPEWNKGENLFNRPKNSACPRSPLSATGNGRNKLPKWIGGFGFGQKTAPGVDTRGRICYPQNRRRLCDGRFFRTAQCRTSAGRSKGTNMATFKDSVFSFWQWFDENHALLEEALKNGESAAATAITRAVLDAHGLSYPCVYGEEGEKYTLTLCPCGDKTAQFLCKFWKEQAPGHLAGGWAFFAIRRPAREELQELADDQRVPPAASVHVFYRVLEEQQKFDVMVTAPLFAGQAEEQRLRAALFLLQVMLGETASELYIRRVETGDAQPGGEWEGPLPLPEFAAMVAQVPLTRPWPWCNDPTTICYGYRLQPEPGAESLREDIALGFTRHPVMLEHPNVADDYLRAKGGAFCYLYFENAGLPPEEAVAARNEALGKVEQLLALYGVGYVLGGATGLFYSYIDLMLLDEPAFCAIFRNPETLLGRPMGFAYFGKRPEYLQ